MALYISDANGQLKKVAGNQRTVDLSDVYPVGSIYMSIDSTSPAGLFGGTWTQISDGYALWTATSGAGGTISAGLPNITGDVTLQTDVPAETISTGVFQTQTGGYFDYTGMSSNRRQSAIINFNATRSSSIYGNSSTVQPPAYKVYAWRRTA